MGNLSKFQQTIFTNTCKAIIGTDLKDGNSIKEMMNIQIGFLLASLVKVLNCTC